jgi:acyl carrier protein
MEAKPVGDSEPILLLLTDILRRQLGRGGRAMRIETDVDLIERGVLDSQGFLDLILEAEQKSDRMFDAERIDFESGGMTLQRLAAAFA